MLTKRLATLLILFGLCQNSAAGDLSPRSRLPWELVAKLGITKDNIIEVGEIWQSAYAGKPEANGFSCLYATSEYEMTTSYDKDPYVCRRPVTRICALLNEKTGGVAEYYRLCGYQFAKDPFIELRGKSIMEPEKLRISCPVSGNDAHEFMQLAHQFYSKSK